MKDRLNATTEQIIGAAIHVHRALGPGLLESAYEACLALEMLDRGLGVERQKPLPLVYRDTVVDCSYRLDVLINGDVVVEVKSVERLMPVHLSQVLSYLRIAKLSLGLIINFNVTWLAEHGINRVVNDFPGP